MKLSLCLHNHQPVGNFDEVVEKAYADCYEPVLECIERHPGIRLAMHHSGCLLDWIEARRPDYLRRMSALCAEGRLELLSGGYYEPVIPVFRRADIQSQVVSMNDRLEALAGSRPCGLWLTERVWEPSVPSILAGTGIEYVVVDDLHLRLAGVDPGSAGLPVLTEDSGHGIALLGSSREMRYAVPFAEVEDVLSTLARMDRDGIRHVFYGDDGEKFGVWPGTRLRCHERGWLDAFLSALEDASGWLSTVLPREAVESLPAVGPFYVPASSYPEMGEWALSPERQESAAAVRRAVTESPDADLFVRTGFWRNFLTRYAEANDLHKRVLHAEKAVRDSGSREALRHLWRSQCNCSYWHGVFGGIYLPHLRDAVWVELAEAERTARECLGSGHSLHRGDIDCDGSEEIVIGTGDISIELRAGEGLSASELTFLPRGGRAVTLGNVLTRRREAYHSLVGESAGGRGSDGTESIHGDMEALEDGLASSIAVDPYRRLSFREVLLPEPGGRDAWFGCRGGMAAVTPGASPELSTVGDGVSARLSYPIAPGFSVDKRLSVSLGSPAVFYESTLVSGPGSPGCRIGCELCLNLLTGSEDDRVVCIGASAPVRTGVCAEGRARRVVVEDGWRRVRVLIESESELDVWQMPLDSVNRSERGFERVHQGVAILFSSVVPPGGRAVTALRLRMEAIV